LFTDYETLVSRFVEPYLGFVEEIELHALGKTVRYQFLSPLDELHFRYNFKFRWFKIRMVQPSRLSNNQTWRFYLDESGEKLVISI
jgi:hypothetical protein